MTDKEYASEAYDIMPKFLGSGDAFNLTTEYLIEIGCDPEKAKIFAFEALEKWTETWTNS